MAPRETKKTVLMQNFGGLTNKQYYGMLWYFLEWSIAEFDYFGWNPTLNFARDKEMKFQNMEFPKRC